MSIPFVSQTGLASFRTLNNQFGMKAPIVGLPLKRSSYDGNLNTTPFDFYNHEMRHGILNDSQSRVPVVIDFIYDCYHQANLIVSNLTDPKIQALCDFFLFELGHESLFEIRSTWSPVEGAIAVTVQAEDIKTNSDDIGLYSPQDFVTQPKDFNEACDNVLKWLEERTYQLDLPIPLDTLIFPGLDMIDHAKKMLLPFINQNHEGQHLFTLIELISNFNLSREKPLSREEITNPVVPGFYALSTELSPYAFEMWYHHMSLQFYNELFGYKEFLGVFT